MIISINNKFSTKQEKRNEKLTTTMWKIWAAKHTFFNGGGDAHFEKRGGRGECRNELQAQSKNHIKAVNSSTILTIAHKQQFSGKLCIFQKRFSLKFPKSIIEIEIIGNFTKHF